MGGSQHLNFILTCERSEGKISSYPLQFVLKCLYTLLKNGGHGERPGFNYIEARLGRPDFEVWKILVAVVMIKVV